MVPSSCVSWKGTGPCLPQHFHAEWSGRLAGSFKPCCAGRALPHLGITRQPGGTIPSRGGCSSQIRLWPLIVPGFPCRALPSTQLGRGAARGRALLGKCQHELIADKYEHRSRRGRGACNHALCLLEQTDVKKQNRKKPGMVIQRPENLNLARQEHL